MGINVVSLRMTYIYDMIYDIIWYDI